MLIYAKLQQPRLQHDSVPRPHLIDRLNQGLDRKVTLISAQAGAGKTTLVNPGRNPDTVLSSGRTAGFLSWYSRRTVLVAQWLEQCRQPSAWLTLDSNDNDLGLFASHLCAAIRTAFPDACGQVLDLLDVSQMPPARVVLAAFANELDDFFERGQAPDAIVRPNPKLILALDDFHTITEPAIHQFVADLITYLPRCLHLAVTSRTDPPFPLAGMRARKEMSELRTGDLRFTMPEAASLLESTLGRQVRPETVALLEEAAEGWAVGLRLAGLSLRNTQDEEHFAQQFREIRSAMIVDYLVSEVPVKQSN